MLDSEKLVAFSKEQPARLLAHYLREQGVSCDYQYVESNYPHTIRIDKLADVPKAKGIAQDFVLNSNDEKYQAVAWQTGRTVSLRAVKSLSLKRVRVSFRRAPLSALIHSLCVVFYVLANIGILGPYQWLHIKPLSLIFESGEWWRVFGPALIHFSLLHIAFNLLWWWSLGSQIERSFGWSALLLLFLFSASISNIAQLLVSGANFGGLSGVVYALVGCVWWLGWLKPQWGLGLPKPIVGFMLVWLMIGFVEVLPINMANTAHAVGLVCGCIYAWILVKYSDKKF